MSRSKRKPWVVDGYGTKWKVHAKAYHNRKLRRKLRNPNYEIPDGCAHKNGPGLNRWDICDYKWYTKKPSKRDTYNGWLWYRMAFKDRLIEWKKLCRK